MFHNTILRNKNYLFFRGTRRPKESIIYKENQIAVIGVEQELENGYNRNADCCR